MNLKSVAPNYPVWGRGLENGKLPIKLIYLNEILLDNRNLTRIFVIRLKSWSKQYLGVKGPFTPFWD